MKAQIEILASGKGLDFVKIDKQVYRVRSGWTADTQGFPWGAQWECSIEHWFKFRGIYDWVNDSIEVDSTLITDASIKRVGEASFDAVLVDSEDMKALEKTKNFLHLQCEKAELECARRADEMEILEKKYNELLFEVQDTRDNETRHETALRYIRESAYNTSLLSKLPPEI